MAVEIISTVLVAATATPPAGPYDLTTLADVKLELDIAAADTSKDAWISAATTRLSAVAANYCNRVFAVEALQDLIYIQQDPYPWQVPGGVYPLQLSRWPMVNAAVVPFTGNTHGTTTVDGIASTAGLTEGLLVFASDGSVPAGTVISAVASNAITLSNAATSSETALAFTTGVQVVQELSVGVTQTLVYGQDYTIDAARGWLIRLNEWTGVSEKWEAEPVTVQYQAGYASVPPDLEEAMLRYITGRIAARGRDPYQVEETQGAAGSQRWWVGTLPGQEGVFPPECLSVFEKYRVPVLG